MLFFGSHVLWIFCRYNFRSADMTDVAGDVAIDLLVASGVGVVTDFVAGAVSAVTGCCGAFTCNVRQI